MQHRTAVLALCSLVAFGLSHRADRSHLPIVDLGYNLHQAVSYNDTTSVYIFSNIRYGQAPTGDLRFRAPLPPKFDRHKVQTGLESRTCPQGVPPWQAKAYGPIRSYSNGRPFNLASWEADIMLSVAPRGNPNITTTEDCLFLDVHVPQKTFNSASERHKPNHGAPVLVWIHGGGYTLGSKVGFPSPGFDPSGLLQQAKKFNKDGIIFVAINYRLGALGFLPGPLVQADGDLNAGLLDQRLALEWVRDNIHLFGGSPERVTIMGESAGGSSALLQLTGWHDEKAPFAQVIAQSPAIMPTGSAPDSAYDDFLSLLNAATLAEARKVSSADIIQANARQVGAAPPTTYVHGPVIDEKTMPDTPQALFSKGAYDKSIRLLLAHNSFEGLFFFDPNVQTEEEFGAWLQRSIPGPTVSDSNYLAHILYPPEFQSNLGYVDQGSRQMALWSEAVIDCTFLSINDAMKGNSYAYQFNVTPGLHTQDLKYTFNDPNGAAYEPIAQDILQVAIASFVVKGVPIRNDDCPEHFPKWGADRTYVSINARDSEIAESKINRTRCAWWRTVLNDRRM